VGCDVEDFGETAVELEGSPDADVGGLDFNEYLVGAGLRYGERMRRESSAELVDGSGVHGGLSCHGMPPDEIVRIGSFQRLGRMVKRIKRSARVWANQSVRLSVRG